jgi:hypothetical protein
MRVRSVLLLVAQLFKRICVCKYNHYWIADGEMFKVTVLFDGTPRTEDGKVN